MSAENVRSTGHASQELAIDGLRDGMAIVVALRASTAVVEASEVGELIVIWRY